MARTSAGVSGSGAPIRSASAGGRHCASADRQTHEAVPMLVQTPKRNEGRGYQAPDQSRKHFNQSGCRVKPAQRLVPTDQPC
jgi:hypothetical protein